MTHLLTARTGLCCTALCCTALCCTAPHQVYAGLNAKIKASKPIIQKLFAAGMAAGEANFAKGVIGTPRLACNNPTHLRLQPHAPRPATLSLLRLQPHASRLQPHASGLQPCVSRL